MEDIDPPREIEGAQDSILNALQKHGLYWDKEVLKQSTRSQAYQSTLETLKSCNLSYPCACNRKRLSSLNGAYDRHCIAKPPSPKMPCATRLKLHDTDADIIHFTDRIVGSKRESLHQSCGDFVIHRKDGLFAYQLAVVVDDIHQGITDIVRGDDLMDCTARQIFLTRLLGATPPSYAHIPVVLGKDGHKLSKQTFAPAINNVDAQKNLVSALNALRVETPATLRSETLDIILQYGAQHFNIKKLKSSPFI